MHAAPFLHWPLYQNPHGGLLRAASLCLNSHRSACAPTGGSVELPSRHSWWLATRGRYQAECVDTTRPASPDTSLREGAGGRRRGVA